MTALALVAIVALVLVNGFFVAAEFSLVSARSELMPEPGTRASRLAERQMRSLDEYLAACQLGITIASLALGALGEVTLANLIEPLLGTRLAADTVAVIATVAALLALTAVHITVGEQAPKSFAIGSAELVASFCAVPLEIFHRAFRPLVLLLNAASNGIVRAFGGRPATEHGGATVEELRHLIGGLTASGQVDSVDARMLRGVFTLDERRALDVLTPRSRVTAVRSDQTIEAALQLAIHSGHPRLPLLAQDGGLLGVVLARDLTEAVLQGHNADSVAESRRDVLITPETQPLDVLLARMREAHVSISAVLDEYGHFVGIVSIEDILEEIVGEIEDESDRPPQLRALANGSVICAGDTRLEELHQYGFHLDGRAETIGGLALALLGHIPQPRETVISGGVSLRVLSMDGNRVRRIHIVPLIEPTPTPA